MTETPADSGKLDGRPLLPKVLEADDRPTIFGARPASYNRKPFVTPAISFDHLSYVSFQNILWTVLCGWWVSICIVITALLLILTAYF